MIMEKTEHRGEAASPSCPADEDMNHQMKEAMEKKYNKHDPCNNDSKNKLCKDRETPRQDGDSSPCPITGCECCFCDNEGKEPEDETEEEEDDEDNSELGKNLHLEQGRARVMKKLSLKHCAQGQEYLCVRGTKREPQSRTTIKL
jgi:hypothetical protein